MTKRKTHPRLGGHFEDFLRDEGRLEEATAVAIKGVDLQARAKRGSRRKFEAVLRKVR